ncbi:hypothetical protein JTB14_010354 [Gonioctena quinquepunctata]|nr:hypothetical protein JTB14_010354 [Gonioctena quinquepunctata]
MKMLVQISTILLVSLISAAEIDDIREKRSLQPGAPDFNKNQPWQLDPQLARDEYGNVIANVNIKRKGENNDFHAGWNKVIDGPNRAKPTYHVGETIRWRRSLQPGAPDFNKEQPWQLDPQLARDEHDNVIANVNIERKGENNDFHAGWNKVIDGPNRAKPTYHVGGTIRWRRSLQPGAPDFNKDQSWQLDPQLARDEHGNVIANVNIKRKGENNDFHAGWNKVIDGPNRAKPTYHVGGRIRWRRSLQPGAPDINKDQPWQVDPQLDRDEHGNVNANVHIKRKGENNDFEASWNKVIDGPNRAKPTFHVGGTIRW